MDLQQGWSLARRAFDAWSDDHAPSMGAALSYYTLFSTAPLLLIVIGVAGFFYGDQAARGEIFGQLNDLMGAEGAKAVESVVANASNPQSGLLAMIIGGAALLLGAAGVFGELQDNLDRIWRAPARLHGGRLWQLLRSRFLSFGMILGIAFLLMVSLVLSAALSSLGKGLGAHLADTVLSFALITLLFAMIYKVIPRLRIRWRDVWIGAAVTAALFVLGKLLIGLYIGNSSVASAFGAAGSLVVLMLWVYYSAQVFLLGAEFTRVYAQEHGSRIGVQEPANDEQGAFASPAPVAAVQRHSVVRLGTALALGIAASIGLKLWWR